MGHGRANLKVRAETRARRPLSIVAEGTTVDTTKVHPVRPTGRTTAKGDRSGLRVPRPTVPLAVKRDGSVNTIALPSMRDAETGHIRGVKIAPCRSCGHVRTIGVATGLCGVKSCRDARQKRYDRDRARRLAQSWLEQKAAAR